jgi:hypothetical protein
MVKNPKSESNSALVKKRRAKAGAPPTIQVQLADPVYFDRIFRFRHLKNLASFRSFAGNLPYRIPVLKKIFQKANI